jgi:chromosome segregation ATPase
MNTSRYLLIMAAALSLPLAGYATHAQAEVTPKEVKQNAATAAGSAATYAEQERDRYIRQAQKEVADLSADIDGLAAKAQTARDEVKAKLDREIKLLGEKRASAEQKLGELQSANANAWQKLKSGMDDAIADLRNAFAKARKEFD